MTVDASRLPRGPADFAQASLDGYEFADRCVARTRLEAHYEPDVECLGEPLERRNARAVLARLDS